MDRIEFINEIAPYAVDACNRWGLYPSICIAQLCLESNFGTSELAVNANNIAGKKWNKDRFLPYYKTTNEYLQMTEEQAIALGFEPVNPEKGLYSKSLPFNLYSSWQDCIEHYCENLVRSKWYSRAIDVINDYTLFLEIMSSIYAPKHPTYANDVMRVIIEYDLQQFD